MSISKGSIAVAVAAMFAATALAQTSAPTQTTAIASQPGEAAIVNATTVSAQVVGVDKATRTLTLKRAQGDVVNVVAGKDVKKFDQIKVGDVVVARYVEAYTLELQKVKSTEKGVIVREGMGRSAPGQAPAGLEGHEMTVIADVVAFDAQKRQITLKSPHGDAVTLDVRNPDQFKVLKVGDQIEVTYIEAVALSVEAGSGMWRVQSPGKGQDHEGHHRWWSGGRRLVRGAAAQARRKSRDRHGGARSVRVVRELRAALPHLRRDREGIEPARGERAVLPHQLSIDARTNCEAISISAKKKTIDLRNVATGETTTESYDKLVLSPGAVSVRPPLPGIDLPGIFEVRTVPDARAVREWIERGTQFLAGMYSYSGIQFVRPTRRAVVIGGGFIGLETAENLIHAGFEVTLVEMLDQLLAPLDREFARLVEEHVKRHGMRLALGDGVAGFAPLEGGAIEVRTKSGKKYPADVVILALGVRPDTKLAKSAGLAIGERGGIRVDEHMRTSDPNIFAVGDAVEVRDFGTGEPSLVALAGPANRQGRIAADVIAGRESRYRGTQGTSIIGLFGAAAAWTGVSEKTLKRLGDDDYEKIYLFPNSHAGYYPGAKPLALKFLFRKSDGRVLGAQALGEDGPAVDKRISALAVAIQMGATIHDLEEAELCYAPQFGSAKDAVNFAGMVAADVLDRDMPLAHWDSAKGAFLLDVRQPLELAVESVPGAKNIPLPELRSRLDRAAQGSRDSRDLPLRPARVLRNADPAAERIQGTRPLRRHVVSNPVRGCLKSGVDMIRINRCR